MRPTAVREYLRSTMRHQRPLIAWGQIRVDVGLAGILMGVMPLMTLLLAHFFVPGEGHSNSCKSSEECLFVFLLCKPALDSSLHS